MNYFTANASLPRGVLDCQDGRALARQSIAMLTLQNPPAQAGFVTLGSGFNPGSHSAVLEIGILDHGPIHIDLGTIDVISGRAGQECNYVSHIFRLADAS